MADTPNGESDVDWNAVVDLLRAGKTAEISCPSERDYVRRTTLITKRAERKGISIEVMRGDGVLRVEPRSGAGGTVTPQRAGEGTESPADRQERERRREARRAERQAERSRGN